MGPCTEDLRRLYEALGLRVASAVGELPDHVAVELEALAYALESPATEAVARALLADHLAAWLPKLCRGVAHEATRPFYRELAALTTAWLPVLKGL
jgi:TorA maturation chaperone TorD